LAPEDGGGRSADTSRTLSDSTGRVGTGVEILGALLSILVIWAVTGVLVVEAINRHAPTHVSRHLSVLQSSPSP
jgi:hypothetical protein